MDRVIARLVMATNVSSRRLACVKCDVLQPQNGKLLSCFHVICSGCATDCVSGEANFISCCSCGYVTKPLVNGAPLLQQLSSCVPSLYETADQTAQPVNTATVVKRLCDLCDDGNQAEATHSCERCNGSHLCSKHVDEHSRKRAFAGHVVELLSTDQQYLGRLSTLKAESARCLFHRHNDVITFCETCAHAICSECLASGHRQHVVNTLSAVADKKRALVRAVSDPAASPEEKSPDVEYFSAPQQPISSSIKAANEEMEEIREEARIASAVVIDTFGRIESVLQSQRRQALEEIEETHWKQLDVTESRLKRLHSLEETQATLGQLTESLTSGKTADTDVVRLADTLEKRIREVKTDLSSELGLPSRPKIRATPSTAAIGQVEAGTMSLVKIHGGDRFDITECAFIIPDDIYVREEFSVRITLPVRTGNPTPRITATCIAPSGQRCDVPVMKLSTPTSYKIILGVQIKPTELGDYSLEIRDSADSVKSAHFSSIRPCPVYLDPQKCSPRISVSNNNRTARVHGRNFGYGSVVAGVGYSTGQHCWDVRLTNVGGYPMAFGVSSFRSFDDRIGQEYFFGAGHYYCWWSCGSCQALPTGRLDNCAEMKNGDTSTLTLDCEKSQLELHHHRTGERHAITGLDCSVPLYPAFCMYRPGHEAEFY